MSRYVYRRANPEEAEKVCGIVQGTKAAIYPHYYTQAVVDFFGRLHSLENITKDIEEGRIDVLLVDGEVVGTGSRIDDHITRVYVMPEYEGKGYGSIIMDHLEAEIFNEYDQCDLDASLPATLFYEHRGFKTVEHKKHELGDGEVMIYEIMEKKRPAKIEMLRLRQYKPEDAATIVSWCRDEESFRKWTSDRYESFPITAEDMNRKYIDNNGDCEEPDNFYPLTAFDDNGIVGHLILRYIGADKKEMRIGFVIVDDSRRGKGYGREMIRLALKYAFDLFKAERVTLGVFDNNPQAYSCYKAAGFKEFSEREVFLLGENWRCIDMECRRQS